MATTLRAGAFSATDASRALADGAAWAEAVPSASGTAAATRAAVSRLREACGKVIKSGHLRVPLRSKSDSRLPAAELSPIRGDLKLCVPASRRVCLFSVLFWGSAAAGVGLRPASAPLD